MQVRVLFMDPQGNLRGETIQQAASVEEVKEKLKKTGCILLIASEEE